MLSREQAYINVSSSYPQNLEGFFVIMTEDGVVDYVSSNVARFAKIGQRDILGQSIFDLAHPKDARKLRMFLSRKKNKLPLKEEESAEQQGLSSRMPERGCRQFFHFRLLTEDDYKPFNIMGHYRLVGKTFL